LIREIKGQSEAVVDPDELYRNEWKFVAIVLDRFCFYAFTLLFIIAVVCTFGQIPAAKEPEEGVKLFNKQ